MQEGAVWPLQSAYDILLQEGAVWPLQSAYDILLQEGAGLYHIWIYIYCERRSAGGGTLTSTARI
jgi:uncharacterized membrane protein